MSGSWMLVAPLLIVAVGGLGMMLADAFSRGDADSRNSIGSGSKPELALVTAVILLAAAAVSLGLWFNGPDSVTPGFIGSYLAYDKLAHFLDLVICGGSALAALLAGGYLREHGIERGEFYVILLFSAFGAMALGRAVDILSIFIAFETMSLGVYGLVGFRRASPRAAEGALKYYLLGSFASAVLLYGLALLYGATGETGLPAIARALHDGTVHGAIEGTTTSSTLLVLSMLLVVVGLAFKVSLVPFHAWTPDAYEGAVTPATTFMAVVVKTAVFGLMIRVLFVAYGDASIANADSGWPPALAGLAALTLVVGNLAAVVQSNVKRMLAYSSISHAGFILIGIVAAWKLGEGQRIGSVLFYLAAYTVSNVLAFGSLVLVGSRGKEAVSYQDLAGVGRRHPWVGVPFALAMLSLMGIPPTAGFFGKYYVVLAAVEAGGGMVWLAVLAVLTSAIGAYYYLRVLVFLFMKEPEQGAPVAVPMRSGYVVAALVAAGYFVLRMGLAPDRYLALVAGPTQHGSPAAGDWTWFLIDGGVAIIAGALAAALASVTTATDERAPTDAPAVSS